MRELDSEFASLGIAVRFVVIGDREKTELFCAPYGLSDRCIPDPDKTSYAEMGLGDFNLLNLLTDPALQIRRAENQAAGFRQNWNATKLQDAAQLPGAAFLAADGNVKWVYRGKHPGDLPPMAEMLAIVKTL